MNISGVSLAGFTAITDAVSARSYNGNIITHADGQDHGIRKPRCTARLATRYSRGTGTRVSWSGRHGPWACWHAYRDVLTALFRAHPDAVVRTSQALYRGQAGFLAAYPLTAGRNIGSVLEPAYMIDLCECRDDDARDIPREQLEARCLVTRTTPAAAAALAQYSAFEAEFGESWHDAADTPMFVP